MYVTRLQKMTSTEVLNGCGYQIEKPLQTAVNVTKVTQVQQKMALGAAMVGGAGGQGALAVANLPGISGNQAGTSLGELLVQSGGGSELFGL